VEKALERRGKKLTERGKSMKSSAEGKKGISSIRKKPKDKKEYLRGEGHARGLGGGRKKLPPRREGESFFSF